MQDYTAVVIARTCFKPKLLCLVETTISAQGHKMTVTVTATLKAAVTRDHRHDTKLRQYLIATGKLVDETYFDERVEEHNSRQYDSQEEQPEEKPVEYFGHSLPVLGIVHLRVLPVCDVIDDVLRRCH